MIKRIFIVSGFALLSLTLNSCGGMAKSNAKTEFTEEFKAIPPAFGDTNTVMLVTLRLRSSYDKYLKKAAEKYKGEYVFIRPGEEILPQYSDKSKYRFVFDYNNGSTYTKVYSDGLSSSSTAKRFFVKDRIEDKVYESGYETSYFYAALQAYMENLEIKRLTKQ